MEAKPHTPMFFIVHSVTGECCTLYVLLVVSLAVRKVVCRAKTPLQKARFQLLQPSSPYFCICALYFYSRKHVLSYTHCISWQAQFNSPDSTNSSVTIHILYQGNKSFEGTEHLAGPASRFFNSRVSITVAERFGEALRRQSFQHESRQQYHLGGL